MENDCIDIYTSRGAWDSGLPLEYISAAVA